MAYLPNQGTTEEEDKQGVNAPMVSSESGTVESGGGGWPGQPQPTRSGNFTNLQTYVRQNQAQAPALGQKVAQNIAQRGTEARGAISGAVQAFTQQVQSKTPTIDQTLLEKSLATPQSLSPEEQARFQSQRFATYGGPMQLQDISEYGQVPSKVQSAEQYGNLLGSEAGRQQLVGDLYGGRTRGPGMLALDAYLLQRTPEALSAAQQAQSGLGSLQSEKTAAEEAARAQAAQAGEAAKGIQNQYQEAFFGPQGAIAQTGEELTQRAQQQYESALAAQQRARTGLETLTDPYVSIPGERRPVTATPSGALPSWAAALGLDDAGFNQLINELQDYSRFDYGGVDTRYYDTELPSAMPVLRGDIRPGYFDQFREIRPDSVSTYIAPELRLGQFAQYQTPEELQAGFTPESVASETERARLAALENLLGTDIGYFSGATGAAPTTSGTFDLASALEMIRERDERANQQAYLMYVMGGGR